MPGTWVPANDQALMTGRSTRLRAALRRVAEKTTESGTPQDLNELETRVHLIDPILGALGYRSFESVRRGVPIAGNRKELDYLLTAGDVRVVVEAKALRSNLGASEAIQLVEYCAVLGVRWALLTNGIRWEIFDIETSGNWESKRVADVEIEEADEGKIAKACEGLALFARDRLSVDEAILIRWTRTERARGLLSQMLNDESSQAVQAITSALQEAGAHVEPREVVELIHACRGMPRTSLEPTTSDDTAQEGHAEESSKRTETGDFYLIPAGDMAGFKAFDHLRTWLEHGFWGLSKSAAHRRRLKRGDLCCFYSAPEGVVATAMIDGSADLEVTSAEWPGPNGFGHGVFKVPLTDINWLPKPRPIDISVRRRLEVFRERDPEGVWSWLVQTPTKLTKADFEVVIGSE